jgi:hypothetical protein
LDLALYITLEVNFETGYLSFQTLFSGILIPLTHRSLALLDLVESVINLQEVTPTVSAEKQHSNKETHFLPFLAVLAASLKSLAVGAPLVPGLRIFSPDPAAIRRRLAAILA